MWLLITVPTPAPLPCDVSKPAEGPSKGGGRDENVSSKKPKHKNRNPVPLHERPYCTQIPPGDERGGVSTRQKIKRRTRVANVKRPKTLEAEHCPAVGAKCK